MVILNYIYFFSSSSNTVDDNHLLNKSLVVNCKNNSILSFIISLITSFKTLVYSIFIFSSSEFKNAFFNVSLLNRILGSSLICLTTLSLFSHSIFPNKSLNVLTILSNVSISISRFLPIPTDLAFSSPYLFSKTIFISFCLSSL